ncbi:tetratricopeptide repeat protein [Nonomuraea wenchangensis]
MASRNNLARTYQDAGDLSRAIPPLEATLADREQVLGADYPMARTAGRNVKAAIERMKAGQEGIRG